LDPRISGGERGLGCRVIRLALHTLFNPTNNSSLRITLLSDPNTQNRNIIMATEGNGNAHPNGNGNGHGHTNGYLQGKADISRSYGDDRAAKSQETYVPSSSSSVMLTFGSFVQCVHHVERRTRTSPIHRSEGRSRWSALAPGLPLDRPSLPL